MNGKVTLLKVRVLRMGYPIYLGHRDNSLFWPFFKKKYFCLSWIFVAMSRLSLVAVQGLLLLWCMGLIVPPYAEFSQTRDRTCAPCIGRQILNHWTTYREVL